MHRRFISTIIATALTITGISSTMAQAGEYRRVQQPQYRTQNNVDPLAATIAGVAALFIIGKAIENNGGLKKKEHHRPKQHVEPQRRHIQERAHNGHRRQDGRHAQRGHNGHRQHGYNGHRNHNRSYEWHRHGNGHGHKHPHGRKHHRGRH